MDLSVNINEAKWALTHKPIRATSVERVLILNEICADHKDWPQPLRFSYMLRTLLSRVSVPLEPYDLIAGRCVDRELTEEEEAIFQSYIASPDNVWHGVFLASGHSSYDWEYLLQNGLPNLKAEALSGMERYKDDAAKCAFLQGMAEIYDTIICFMLRYAEAAEEKGMVELSEQLKEAASGVPTHFASAMQLLYTVAFIDCAYITCNPTLTLGRMDTLLWPLYRKDLADGTITREKAAALITDMYCKHNLTMGRGEHQVGGPDDITGFERICNFDAPQYMLLCGSDENGCSAANELTELLADCIVPEFKNPVVVVYYTTDLNTQKPVLWDILTEKAMQSSSMMFYHDGDVMDAFEKIGLPRETYRNYYHFGCNWAAPSPDAAHIVGGSDALLFTKKVTETERQELLQPPHRRPAEHSWPEEFNIILHQLAQKEDAGQALSIEDFYTAFFERAECLFTDNLARFRKVLEILHREPSTLLNYTDCFLSGSMQRAECFTATAEYHFAAQSFQMFGTTVDCFITVDSLVYQKKRVTLRALSDAVDTNFENDPALLGLIRHVPKYGSGDAFADSHVKRLSSQYVELVCRVNHPTLEETGMFLVPCMQCDTWHLKLGEKYMATPNGRLAGEAFSQNTRPSIGAAVNGMPAMLNSMLNLPAGGLASGALNLDIQPKDYEGETGKKVFGAILASYFNRGGLHAQVSSVDVKDLEDARLNPEAYRDLRVRVTGYSGVFVDICDRLQQDIINRMK